MTNNDTPSTARPGVLATLRQMVPARSLLHREALLVAERQAGRLRELLGVTTTDVSDEALRSLPHTEIITADDLPASGGTHWSGNRWLLVVNGSEPYTRQRFSVAHELFHVIAHPRLTSLTPNRPGRNPRREIERLADYFAGVLLMPRAHLTRLWTSGTQQLDELAGAFNVSERAIEVRLDQLGLGGTHQRCWPTPAIGAHDQSTASPLPIRKAAA